jgi:hypothetical protein
MADDDLPGTDMLWIGTLLAGCFAAGYVGLTLDAGRAITIAAVIGTFIGYPIIGVFAMVIAEPLWRWSGGGPRWSREKRRAFASLWPLCLPVTIVFFIPSAIINRIH